MMIVVYIPSKDQDTVRKFKEIAQREGGYSKVIREFITNYVKAHASGNPNIPLDTWVKEPKAIAYPSSWVAWKQEDLEEYSSRELNQMRELLSKNLRLIDATIERRYEERSKEG